MVLRAGQQPPPPKPDKYKLPPTRAEQRRALVKKLSLFKFGVDPKAVAEVLKHGR